MMKRRKQASSIKKRTEVIAAMEAASFFANNHFQLMIKIFEAKKIQRTARQTYGKK